MLTDYLKNLLNTWLQKYSEHIRKKKLTPEEIRIFYITKGKKIENIVNNTENEIAKIVTKFMEDLE